MNMIIIYINDDGARIVQKIKGAFAGCVVKDLRDSDKSNQEQMTKIFKSYAQIIFIGATGIAVRLIGSLTQDKHSDPAVVCIDTAGRYAISLLSGHEGGANDLAYKLAATIGAQAIITTGTESRKTLTLGVGCRRGVSVDQVKNAINDVLSKADIALSQIRCAASVDIKRDEEGLLLACQELNIPLVFFSTKQIAMINNEGEASEVVQRNLGIDGVCEPCALLAGRAAKLKVTKQIKNGVTIACAEESFLL